MTEQKCEEFPKEQIYAKRGKYTIKCDCGKIHSLFTQLDNFAEYVTTVIKECECGKDIYFSLPVN